MISFLIKGELADLNSYIRTERGNRFAAAKLKEEETNRVYWEIKEQKLLPLEAEYPIKITYKWYCQDNRKDTDNVAFSKKFINDGLVLAGIIPNDSRKYIAGFMDEFYTDKENPRVEVILGYPHIEIANDCKI